MPTDILNKTLCDPPEGIYLCQVSRDVSCGACCGLFNISDPRGDHLERMLLQRTTLFSKTPRTISDIDNFARKINGIQPGEGPVPDLHHCPFLGLVGENRSRVGCLLHPLASLNGGTDFRGLSYHGSLACRVYFCASHRLLPRRWKQCLLNCITHWRLFSAVASEHLLISGLLSLLEERLGRPLEPEWLSRRPAAAVALEKLFALKLNWPHVKNTTAWIPNPFGEDTNRRREPDWFDLQPGPHVRMAARELCSFFPTREEAADGLKKLEEAVDSAAEAMDGQ